MFQKAELARLRAQKDLLVAESNTNRLLLRAQWQRVISPEHWVVEARRSVARHPLWTAVLAAAAGLFTFKAVRNPEKVAGGLGRLGSLASTAISIWKLLRRRKAEE